MEQGRWCPRLVVAGVMMLAASGLLAEEGADLEAELTVSRTATEVVGKLAGQGEVVLEFVSRRESTGAVEIEISWPGALFLGSFDPEAGVLTIRGFGSRVRAADKPLIAM